MYCLYYTVFYCKDCDRRFSIDDYELYYLVDKAPQQRPCPGCGRLCADIDRHRDLVEEPSLKEAFVARLKEIFKF